MTKEQISMYAIGVTTIHQRTILKFKDGRKIVGFFETNAQRSLADKNKWNFVELQQEQNNNKSTIINGDDIETIEIIPKSY